MNDIVPNDFSPPIDVESTKVKIALSGLPVNISPHWQAEISGWREIATIEDSRFFDRIVNNVPNGLGNQPALDLYFGKGMVSGCLGTRHSKEVEDRYKSLEYGQQDRISRSIRLDPEGFCPTLRAGTARDRGSYQAVRPIHYEKPRVITPREAARLQGFPDWFVFHSTKWHSFRQIGNSVSPIVSELILSVLNSNLQ
jgi:DNA (cytosine-5)-methyltransferase 1